jgi:16S rRNA (cytidine1402-2'-O)-methyltransferase
MSGTLYIVATPIGNLQDMSPRAVQILDKVTLILAEDTRSAKKILTHFDIKTPVKSYHQHTSANRRLEVLNMLLQGQDLALITDAGTPGISDPGNELVGFLYEHGPISIIPIPGVSAVSAVISVCGFNMQRYIFISFMPKKGSLKLLKNLRELNMPVVYFDSPHRVVKNLEVVREVFGEEVRIFVGREMTKMYENYYRGNVADVMGQLLKQKVIKGEISVVVEVH